MSRTTKRPTEAKKVEPEVTEAATAPDESVKAKRAIKALLATPHDQMVAVNVYDDKWRVNLWSKDTSGPVTVSRLVRSEFMRVTGDGVATVISKV